MKRYKGAIFDLDGTLLDSMWVWSRIDKDFLANRGFSVPEDYMERIAPMGALRAAVYTIERFQLKESPEVLVDEWLSMAQEAYEHQVTLKPYVKEYLENLNRLGVSITAATSSERTLVLPALARNGILPYFKEVITVNEVKRGKGFPDIYERAADVMGFVPRECVVYEDILEGIRGAKKGGFLTVGVYEPESDSCRQAITAEADVYIENFEELLIKHRDIYCF